MGENVRVALAVLLVAGGIGLVLPAIYLQYVALPAERTRSAVGRRIALALTGLVLVLVGSRFA